MQIFFPIVIFMFLDKKCLCITFFKLKKYTVLKKETK